ncbi:hypothetical protein F4778DRAFT_430904 [Xylariomycetidae sp. FL2044]|nr:hypothetical protein F4778DRAFT_430904 [Xylariomycetidae sp. FL2044]
MEKTILCMSSLVRAHTPPPPPPAAAASIIKGYSCVCATISQPGHARPAMVTSSLCLPSLPWPGTWLLTPDCLMLRCFKRSLGYDLPRIARRKDSSVLIYIGRLHPIARHTSFDRPCSSAHPTCMIQSSSDCPLPFSHGSFGRSHNQDQDHLAAIWRSLQCLCLNITLPLDDPELVSETPSSPPSGQIYHTG